MFTMV